MTSAPYLHQVLTGKDFNEKFPGQKIKFMNDDLIHNGYKYELGLNIYKLPFNPTDEYFTGLYFYELRNGYNYCKSDCKTMAYVSIPDEASVYIKEDMFKTDKLFIEKIMNFDEIPDDVWISYIKCDGMILEYIKNQTTEICLEAVKQVGRALAYVELQTSEICLEAVRQDGMALAYVKKQTPEICLEAVEQDGQALQYVKNQTPAICIKAVKQDGMTLTYVKHQTPEICSEAIKQNREARQFVKE